MSNLPQESWQFSIVNHAIQHQGIRVIDLHVSYDYRPGLGATNPFEYPDFLPVASFVQNFLINYPNETDFWEILNRKLVESLLTDAIPTRFGFDYRLAEMVDNVEVTLAVHPSPATPYARASTIRQEVQVGGAGRDRFDGTFYGDAMRGEAGDDILRGNGGDDYLSGGAGNDRLFGGDGADTLVGGAGADAMTGGAGADSFLFARASELGAIDRILDFNAADGDRIDLSGIDPIPGTGNEAFTLVSRFSGAAGELVLRLRADGAWLVRGNVDGDAEAELQIVVTSAAPLTADAFIL